MHTSTEKEDQMSILKKIDWFYPLSLLVLVLAFSALHYANRFPNQTYNDIFIGSIIFWLGLLLMRLSMQYHPTWKWLKIFFELIRPLLVIDILYSSMWFFGSSNQEGTLHFDSIFDGLLLSVLYICRSAPILSIVSLVAICFKQTVPESMVVILNGYVYHPGENYRKLWFLKEDITFFSTSHQVYAQLGLTNLKDSGINGTIVFDIDPSIRELSANNLIKLAQKQFAQKITNLFSAVPFDTAIRELSQSKHNEWRVMPGVYAKIACTKLKITTLN